MYFIVSMDMLDVHRGHLDASEELQSLRMFGDDGQDQKAEEDRHQNMPLPDSAVAAWHSSLRWLSLESSSTASTDRVESSRT